MELNKNSMDIVEPAQVASSPSSCPRSKKRKSRCKKVKGPKMKPTNSLGQFLKMKRQDLIVNNSSAKVDLSAALEEWRNMGSEQKKFYEECSKKEKEEMNFIGKHDRKVSNSCKKAKKTKDPKPPEVKENSTLKFLSDLESIDKQIIQLRAENKVISDQWSNQKEEYAVNKYKLKMVTEEYETLKDKYILLETQHSMCSA